MTHRLYSLPVVILAVTGRCNCRCLMCDIWRDEGDRPELTAEQLEPHMAAFEKMDVRHAVLSGGEPLLHHDLWGLCARLRQHGVEKITLLTAGLLLARHAGDVVKWCDAAIVSLDGRGPVHDAIRNVPHAHDRLAAGVAALKAAAPGFEVTARCVVQRANYAGLGDIVDDAHEMGLDGISFLGVDVSSAAFNRQAAETGQWPPRLAIPAAEVGRFRRVIEGLIRDHAHDLATGFVAEPAAKLRRLADYAAALNGDSPFPPVCCNAPWVSTMIEADGSVRPCFFQPAVGNLAQQPLAQILNSEPAIAFRRRLDVTQDPTCRRCVCTLNMGLRARGR